MKQALQSCQLAIDGGIDPATPTLHHAAALAHRGIGEDGDLHRVRHAQRDHLFLKESR